MPAATSASRRARPASYSVGVEQPQRRDVASANAIEDVGRVGRHALVEAMHRGVAEPGPLEVGAQLVGVGEAAQIDRRDRREVRVQEELAEVLLRERADGDPSAPRDHSPELGDRRRPVVDEMKHQVGVRRVEPPVPERELCRLGSTPAHAAARRAGPFAARQHLGGGVDAPHSRAKPFGRQHREPARAAPHVEEPGRAPASAASVCSASSCHPSPAGRSRS